jgi:hypothetical protein
VPAKNVAEDTVDDIGRPNALIVPAWLAQGELGGPLDQSFLDGA